jgi:hypothetical protein
MSIYATLWALQFPRFGEFHIDREWVTVIAQGVPAHVGAELCRTRMHNSYQRCQIPSLLICEQWSLSSRVTPKEPIVPLRNIRRPYWCFQEWSMRQFYSPTCMLDSATFSEATGRA